MPDIWKSLTAGFMPHGYCMRWDDPLLLVFIAGNVGIAIAYFLIPLALRCTLSLSVNLLAVQCHG